MLLVLFVLGGRTDKGRAILGQFSSSVAERRNEIEAEMALCCAGLGSHMLLVLITW